MSCSDLTEKPEKPNNPSPITDQEVDDLQYLSGYCTASNKRPGHLYNVGDLIEGGIHFNYKFLPPHPLKLISPAMYNLAKCIIIGRSLKISNMSIVFETSINKNYLSHAFQRGVMCLPTIIGCRDINNLMSKFW